MQQPTLVLIREPEPGGEPAVARFSVGDRNIDFPTDSRRLRELARDILNEAARIEAEEIINDHHY